VKYKNVMLLSFIVILFYIAACAPAPKQATNAPAPVKSVESASQASTSQASTAQPASGISDEVKDLLAKSKTRVNGIYYKYRGPQTGNNFFEFYVKGTKIMYKPARELKSLDRPDSYDSIFIDKTAKTAQSYCIDRMCVYKGKKADLNYADSYINTILDWTSVITTATKVGEEVIDDRSVWKVETNVGILWLDTFYGIPLKMELGGQTYRFQQIAPNSVQDSDVTPS